MNIDGRSPKHALYLLMMNGPQGFTVNGYTESGSIDDVGDIDGRNIRDIARDKLIYATGSPR